jgi:L-arabinose isomerase
MASTDNRIMTSHALPFRPRVGLLALTLELYEELAPDLRAGREQWVRRCVLPALADAADVQFEGAVYRTEDIRSQVARFEAEGVDALLILCLTYSPSQVALPALVRTKLPIVIWNTQELAAVDEAFDTARMIDNHGVHGTQDLANVLLRAGVQFEYVTSLVDDAEAIVALGDFFAAAAAVAALRSVRVGLLGYAFPGMGDFAADTTHLAATLGCQWRLLALEDYLRRAAACEEGQVRAVVEEYRRLYDLASDLTPEDLDVTARAELALRAMVAEERLAAFSYQFMAFGQDERSQTLPFVAASRLMAEGVGFAGEGDVVGAIGTWLLDRLQCPATFSEIFTIDFAGQALLMSHMGEANVAMTRRDRRVRLVARRQPITPTRGRQLALVQGIEPGPATLCALSQGPGQRWRLIASRVAVEDYGPLEGMEVPHFKVRPGGGDVRAWLTAYGKLGGPHHHALCFGDATARIRAAAGLLDADYCEI